MFSVGTSIKRFRTTYLDVLYVHYWDCATDTEEIMDGLHNLVTSGKVLYLVCHWSPLLTTDTNPRGNVVYRACRTGLRGLSSRPMTMLVSTARLRSLSTSRFGRCSIARSSTKYCLCAVTKVSQSRRTASSGMATSALTRKKTAAARLGRTDCWSSSCDVSVGEMGTGPGRRVRPQCKLITELYFSRHVPFLVLSLTYTRSSRHQCLSLFPY